MKELRTLKEARDFISSDEFGEAAYRDIDLREVTELMRGLDFGSSLFLGCQLAPEMVTSLAEGGAFLIRDIEGFTFPVHRARLYTAEELFDGFDPEQADSHRQTLDHLVYREYVESGGELAESIKVTLARRLHDHSITEALGEKLAGRKVVAIMGGHGLERGNPMYFTVARIARLLTKAGFLLVSGGGPGAMEACHVGAFFATRCDSLMHEAILSMSTRPEGGKPKAEYSDPDWLHRAWRMKTRFAIPTGQEMQCESVGIPTWTYGHEPPAVFASHIAKYFANSVREDGLLMVADHGVVFAPGSAGTIQEIFQDACQNHYFVANKQCSPMILFGRQYWTQEKPVWPLLSQLAQDQMYGELLCLTDSVETVVRKILSYRPDLYRDYPTVAKSMP